MGNWHKSENFGITKCGNNLCDGSCARVNWSGLKFRIYGEVRRPSSFFFVWKIKKSTWRDIISSKIIMFISNLSVNMRVIQSGIMTEIINANSALIIDRQSWLHHLSKGTFTDPFYTSFVQVHADCIQNIGWVEMFRAITGSSFFSHFISHAILLHFWSSFPT